MKKLIFLIVAVLLSSAQLYSQWVQQSSPTSLTLYNIHFLNSQTGYIAGSTGTIFKTTNGGTNWVLQTTPITLEVKYVTFLDANTGFASCGDDSPSHIGAILKTTNGGTNWVTKFSSNRIYFEKGIHFVNSNTGFASGWAYHKDSAVYKTTNGGENWFSANVLNVYGLDNLSFIDANTGWGVGDAGSSGVCVIKTTNGGANWAIIYNTTNAIQLMSFQFVDANTGWIVGISTSNQSLIQKTTNGGLNWVDQVNQHPSNWELYNIQMLNENTGWIIGDIGQIVKTTNGGVNWRAQNSISLPLWGIDFISSDTGWVVGYNGLILKTVNGGGPVSVQNISTEVPSAYSLKQNYPNPFNPATKIKFDVASVKQASLLVTLKVYDVSGREVKTLVNESLQPGTYETTFDGSKLNSGVYFYKLTSGDFTETKRMLLIK